MALLDDIAKKYNLNSDAPVPEPISFVPGLKTPFANSGSTPARPEEIINGPTPTFRAPFAKEATPGFIASTYPLNIAADQASRLLEIVPKAILQTVQNYRTINDLRAGKDEQALTLPFDPKRLGFEGPIESTGKKLWDNFLAREAKNPSTDNIGVFKNAAVSVFQTVVPDALDAAIAGDVVRAGAGQILKATHYDPALDYSLSRLGLKRQFTLDEFRQRFVQTAQDLAAKGDTEGLRELGQVTQVVADRYATGETAFKLNKFGEFFQNLASNLTRPVEDIGKSFLAPPLSQPNPELPGYRKRPGQAPAFGLSTEEIEGVGFGKNEKPKPNDIVPVPPEELANAVGDFESSGNYQAKGPIIKDPKSAFYGDRAYGKYQIMGKNIEKWTKEYLGKAYTIKEFLADPKIQDALIVKKFGQELAKGKPWEDVVSEHFSGKPAKGNVAKDQLGTSVPKYIEEIKKRLGQAVIAPDVVPGEKSLTYESLVSEDPDLELVARRIKDMQLSQDEFVNSVKDALKDQNLTHRDRAESFMEILKKHDLGLDDFFKVVQEAQAKVNKDIPDYRYHTTSPQSLDSIKKVGLTPSNGQYGKGVYFAPSAEETGGYGAKEGAMIRIKKENLPGDYQEFPEQGWTSDTIPPQNLEYSLDKGKTWKTLLDAQAPGKTSESAPQKLLSSEPKPIVNKKVDVQIEPVEQTKEVQGLKPSLKARIKTFFRPSRQLQSRAFNLLGNKDTTVPLFKKIFADWVKQGVDTIIEPYAGAFTLGTHSLEDAIKAGLKEYKANIFDKEKFLMVKAIQDGQLPEVKKAVDDAVQRLSEEIVSQAKKNKDVYKIIQEFQEAHPGKFVGSDAWFSFIREKPIGSQVTVFGKEYSDWRKVFQDAFDKLFKDKVETLDDAAMKALIQKIGVFGGKGQSLLRTNGFTTFENKIYGKYGLVNGLEDIDKIFKLAEKHGTTMDIQSMDGAKFTDLASQGTDPKSTAYYFDPPYVNTAMDTYKGSESKEGVTDLEKFTTGEKFVEAHKAAFEEAKKGAKIALTNDVNQGYIESVEKSLGNPALFAYKEGNTPTSLIVDAGTKGSVDEFLTTSEKATPGQREEVGIIKGFQAEKHLSDLTMGRIRKTLGIKETKNATDEQLSKFISILQNLEDGDKFVTDLQRESLADLIKSGNFPDPNLITQRELIEKFGDPESVMNGRLTKFIATELIPTVDIKEGHPMIERVVNKADELMDFAAKEIERRDTNFSKMIKKAEASRAKLLPFGERVRRSLAPQNKEIFQALSGQSVELTKEEAAVVAYLRNFFEKVRKDLGLEKFRKNYVTHLEKPILEKLVTSGIPGILKDMFNMRELNIPTNIMLELDNIIGSEKFFKFALERKGGLDPTTNLRKIVHDYGSLYETKKALDQTLPEGQAIVQLLLDNTNAKWLKRFLQNLKGRGLDSNFRTSRMGWLTKVADSIVDVGYVKLLALNWKSALKNIVAGESNSFIYQDFIKFLTGKTRFFGSPKRAIQLAKEFGILDGTYADYSAKGIANLKKGQDLLMIGQQAGEYEIRTSLFLSELTPEEWKSGEVTPERIRKIKDIVAITQGVFSKVDSPLWVQTWYGRMFMQMNRWRITNAMLFRRLVRDAAAGKEGSVFRLAKAFILYGIGMYLSFEFGKAGYKKAADISKAMAEEVNSIVELGLMKPITDALTNNPTFQALGQFTVTIQELAAYINTPGVKAPSASQKGIEDTYIAPIENVKSIFGYGSDSSSGGASSKNLAPLPGLRPEPGAGLNHLPGLEPASKLPALPGL